MASNFRVKCTCGFEYLQRSREACEEMARAHLLQPTRMDESVVKSGGHAYKITEETTK